MIRIFRAAFARSARSDASLKFDYLFPQNIKARFAGNGLDRPRIRSIYRDNLSAIRDLPTLCNFAGDHSRLWVITVGFQGVQRKNSRLILEYPFLSINIIKPTFDDAWLGIVTYVLCNLNLYSYH